MRNKVVIAIAVCAGIVAATAQGMRPAFPFAGRGKPFAAHHDGRVGPRQGLESAFDPSSFMIDTSIVYSPATDDQLRPKLASDGEGWLVVWSDSRDYTLRAGRLDANGVLLDTCGVVIAGITDYYQMQADVTFDGENYLVVWGTGSEYSGDVRAAHVSPAGELLDTFTVSAEQEGQSKPAVASAGDTSLVVWVDTRDFEANLYAARVLRSGEVVDPAGFLVAPLTESYNTAASVERGGDEFLVAWSDYASDTLWTEDIFAMRIGVDGTLKDTGAVRLSTSDMGAASPAVAFGDTFFLVAWEERDYSSLNVVGRRMTVSGTLLDPNYIRIAPFASEQQDAAATFDGTNYLVTWIDYDYNDYIQTVRARRVTTGGVLLDPNQIRICPDQTSAARPAACYNGTDFVVALEGYGAETDVYCARVSSAGVVRDPGGIALPLGVESQESPSVAFDGVNYLAVWYEQGNGGVYDVCGARITPAGAVLDPKGFTIGEATSLLYGGVAFGAGEYLVAWTSGTEDSDSIVVRAARVTPGGTVLDTIPLQPGTGMGYDVAPDVAFDGTNFLVVWCFPADSGPGIYGARVAPDGTVLDPAGFPISDGRGYEILPSVAFDSANYIITWSCSDSYYSDVYCALVSPAGAVVVPTTLVSGDSCDQAYPRVACGPSSSLIVWMDYRINGSYSDIFAARVSHSGEVLDPEGILVTNSSYDEQLSDVVFDGSAYQLFWSSLSLDSGWYSGAKLDTAGRPLSWFRPFGRADNGYYGGNTIGAAAGAAGEALAVYQSWTDEAGGRQYGNYRIWGRLGPFDGVAETENARLTTTRRVQTIVRGVLFLPESGTRSELPGRNSVMSRAALLDISGRKVIELRPGANDVSHLAPGVYFVSEAQAQAVQKIVVTR